MKKRVAVIGAGASGLVAIKSCIDEGMEPVCLERTDNFGGLWRFIEDVTDGQGSVTETTVINTSKEMMCYSDYPIPRDFPNFMHNTKVYEYFLLYAKKFDLEKHVRFNTEVRSVARAEDFKQTGKWNIEYCDKKSGKTSSETFDAVLVCTGHHAEKNVPHFEGEDSFKGKIVHTHDFRGHKGFEGKRVVVVGLGNSAGDAAVDLSRIASQVYLSTRRGSWVINRIGKNGTPTDMIGNRRIVEFIRGILPSSLMNSFLENELNNRFDHETYGLKPKHRFDSVHPMVNDELPNRLACGTVILKPDIKRFTETGIEFEDGTKAENIDAVLLGTGYIFGFPFLEKGVVEVRQNKVELFKYMVPPDLDPPTLAVIGFVQPWGAINPIAELQCRLAARVFKGVQRLPTKDEMWADIRRKQKAMSKRYVPSQRHTVQVDYIPIMDELAELVGCKPNLSKMLFSDPRLALSAFFGPCTPYQYRLEGPGAWAGARDAIMTTWDRVAYPFKTRPTEPSGVSFGKIVLLIVVAAIVLRWVLNFITMS